MTLERRAPLTRKTPLAPGKPLTRKTPLAAGKPLARATPIARSAPTTRATQAQRQSSRDASRRPRDTGPSAQQRDVVLARDAHRCARCGVEVGTAVGYNDHHRQGRGMGGRKGAAAAAANLPSRRLILCGSGTTGCHGWVTEHPAEAEREGLVVRRGGGLDPALVPALTWRGWVLLDDDGGWSSCPAPPEGDARNAPA